MDIILKDNGTVTLHMKHHIEDAIQGADMGILKGAMTPALKMLFDVDEESEKLEKQRSNLLQSSSTKPNK